MSVIFGVITKMFWGSSGARYPKAMVAGAIARDLWTGALIDAALISRGTDV